MFVEELYYRKVLGVEKEFADPNPLAATLLDPIAATLLVVKTRRYIRKHQSVVEGYPLPKKGAAIVTGNHHKEGDSFKALEHAIQTAGRLIDVAVKMSLVKKGAVESREYLESIDAYEDDKDDEYNPIYSFVLRHTGAIGLLRDNPDRNFVRKVHAGLRSGHLIGIYLQPHRYDDCFLRNLQTGAAYFAKKYPDIPVYPIAFSGPPDGPDKATFIEPYTYNQMRDKYGREISAEELTVMTADMIVSELPLASSIDWQVGRSVELDRLTASKK